MLRWSWKGYVLMHEVVGMQLVRRADSDVTHAMHRCDTRPVYELRCPEVSASMAMQLISVEVKIGVTPIKV